ncbi:MAG: NAD(P)-dependent oxidoreductase [Chloroflexi bacterium]|nr:NAD(P)-dependent oxidoreductase [Chloroflexota bacterium]
MNVLLTGAFGNIGQNALRELIEQGHKVRCFDIRSKGNLKAARRYGSRIEVVWGDIRRPDDVTRAVVGCDAVIHLAAIIPPLSEERPDWAAQINVEGSRTLVAAMAAQPTPPRLVFASSVSVYGPTRQDRAPRRASDPVHPTDHYTHHKVACEGIIRASGLQWTILRLGVVPPIRLRNIDPAMFEVSLDARLEYVNTRDVGLALANAVSSSAVWGRTLLIGGGPSCQMHYRDYVGSALQTMGIGRLPASAFSPEPYYTEWMDTSESEALLHYQRHGFGTWLRDLRRQFGVVRYLVPLVRPFVRWGLLLRSRHYRSMLSLRLLRWSPTRP